MKISVLMSVYNKEKCEYLDVALKSIVSQTLMPDEIVIVKDGILNEELENVLKKYENSYKSLIKIYGINEHMGLGKALSYGAMKCSYEYIARMDSDDFYVPDRLEKQVGYLNEHSELDVLGGYIEEYDENLEVKLTTKKVPLTNEEIRKAIKFECPMNHGTTIMKKAKLLEAGNYDETIIEDYDLWARMILKNAKMTNMPVVLSKNRTGIRMYKKRSSENYIKGIKEIENKLYKYGLINRMECTINKIVRISIAKAPIKLKFKIYSFMRKIS